MRKIFTVRSLSDYEARQQSQGTSLDFVRLGCEHMSALHPYGNRSPSLIDATNYRVMSLTIVLGAVLVLTLDMATAKLVLLARHRVVPLGRCVRASSKVSVQGRAGLRPPPTSS